jgi:predicted DNA-binding transcriptional regulator AlpA
MSEQFLGGRQMGRKKLVSRIESPFLNVIEAGQFLRVKTSTIYSWIHKKEIMKFPVRYHGRKPVFLLDELKKWSDERNHIVMSGS